MAAATLLLALVLSMFAGSDAAWCVCRTDAGNTALQKALDYACGAGADCNPILQNGACYQPNTVAAHCSYAANSYYQRKGQAQGACDFSGSATLTNSDPSANGCTFPATPSAAGTSGTPTTGTPTTGTPSTLSPPSTMTGGTTGGMLGSLGPSGTSTGGMDSADGGLLPRPGMVFLLLTMLLSALLAIRI